MAEVPLTVWSHDPFTVSHDVLLHPTALPNAKAGDIAQIRTFNSDTKQSRTFYFVVGPQTESPTVQISVSTQVLNSLDVVPRNNVFVSLRSSKSVEINTAEFRFKGVYLTRADLYRISKQLTGQCLRVGQRVPFLGGSARLLVDNLYRKGKRKYSGYIGQDTHIVYRSDSARIVILIQLSVEMWDFDETGEIGFQKLVGSLIPESLRQLQDTQHTMTVILFSSLSGSNRKSRLLPGELEPKPLNHYRVAIDSAPVSQWSEILSTLRREFFNFKSVLVGSSDRLSNQPLPASKGNLLEAIRYVTSFTSNKFTDRDLCRTNLQVLAITASPGLFDVDEVDLNQVSKSILGVEIGVELVCLSRPPLHMTPMFRAKDANGVLKHYIPTWMNVSFYGPTERYVKQWIPRCKIYDIQMMGVMENEMKAISVRHLPPGAYTSRFMKNYDAAIFKTAGAVDQKEETPSYSNTPLSSLRPTPMGSVHTAAIAMPTVAIAHPEIIAVEDSLDISAQGKANTSTLRDSLDSVLKHSSRKRLNKKHSINTFRSALSSVADISSPLLSSVASIHSYNTLPRLSLDDAPEQVPEQRLDQILEQQPEQRLDWLSNGSPIIPRTPSRTMPIPMPIPDSRNSTLSKKQSARALANLKLSPAVPAAVPQRGNLTRKSTAQSPQKHGSNPKSASALSPMNSIPQCSEPLSIASAGNMWRVLKNPSVIDHPTRTEAYGRWAYVYPRGTKRKNISWNTIKSPASLPITSDVFPTLAQFHNEYKFQFYDLATIPGNSTVSTPQLFDELIGARLQMGFQIAVGDAVSKVEGISIRGNPALLKSIIPQDNFLGVRIFMVREGTIHRLCIEQDDLINVRIYTWVDPNEPAHAKSHYKPEVFLRTKYEETARRFKGQFFDPLSQFNIKWNLLDQQICGLVDYFNDPSAQYTRATRFVIIPIPSNKAENSQQNGDKLSLEELRIEGILKIVSYISKHQVKTSNAKTDIASQVVFYTGFLNNAPEYIFHETEESQNIQGGRLHKSISLNDLANELNGKWGPKRKSRRWHWKNFSEILLGDVLVNWIVHHFSDINTREEATKYAQGLMDQKFLVHVEQRTKFNDGHFFYRMSSDYAAEQSDVSEESASKKSHCYITRALMLDIDPKKVSGRPEHLQVHIDRFHNPEHSFNIRAEWLNATPKLIDEFFNGISRLCSSYALRLVQLPEADIADTEKHSPFISSFVVSFCLDPLSVIPNPEAFADVPFYFHHHFLKRMGFVFDGTDMHFQTQKFQLEYTWRGSEFHRAQYLHHSGSVIVQVLEDMSFYMVPNTIFLSRYVSGPASQMVGIEDTIQKMFERVCNNPEVLEEIFVAAAEMDDSRANTPPQTPPPAEIERVSTIGVDY